MLSSSVSKKSAARIFHGRITGIATNRGEKAIRKTWFWVMSNTAEKRLRMHQIMKIWRGI
jgi:hypothetical protein